MKLTGVKTSVNTSTLESGAIVPKKKEVKVKMCNLTNAGSVSSVTYDMLMSGFYGNGTLFNKYLKQILTVKVLKEKPYDTHMERMFLGAFLQDLFMDEDYKRLKFPQSDSDRVNTKLRSTTDGKYLSVFINHFQHLFNNLILSNKEFDLDNALNHIFFWEISSIGAFISKCGNFKSQTFYAAITHRDFKFYVLGDVTEDWVYRLCSKMMDYINEQFQTATYTNDLINAVNDFKLTGRDPPLQLELIDQWEEHDWTPEETVEIEEAAGGEDEPESEGAAGEDELETGSRPDKSTSGILSTSRKYNTKSMFDLIKLYRNLEQHLKDLAHGTHFKKPTDIEKKLFNVLKDEIGLAKYFIIRFPALPTALYTAAVNANLYGNSRGELLNNHASIKFVNHDGIQKASDFVPQVVVSRTLHN